MAVVHHELVDDRRSGAERPDALDRDELGHRPLTGDRSAERLRRGDTRDCEPARRPGNPELLRGGDTARRQGEPEARRAEGLGAAEAGDRPADWPLREGRCAEGLRGGNTRDGCLTGGLDEDDAESLRGTDATDRLDDPRPEGQYPERLRTSEARGGDGEDGLGGDRAEGLRAAEPDDRPGDDRLRGRDTELLGGRDAAGRGVNPEREGAEGLSGGDRPDGADDRGLDRERAEGLRRGNRADGQPDRGLEARRAERLRGGDADDRLDDRRLDRRHAEARSGADRA